MKFPQITLNTLLVSTLTAALLLSNHHQVSASSSITSIAHASDSQDDTSPASSASLRSTNSMSAKEASSVLSTIISDYQHQDLKNNHDEEPTNTSMTPAVRMLQSIANPGSITTSSDQWELVGNVLTGDRAGDFFGRSVAMSKDGMVIVIGATGSNDNGSNSGQTKVFGFNQQAELWEQLGQTIVGESAGDYSGSSVDMNARGDVIIISARYNDGNGGYYNGHARVFKITDGQWVQKGQDLDGDEENDYFGHSVAMNGEGDRVIAGAIYSDDNGPYSGHTKVLEYNQQKQLWEQLGQTIVGESAGDNSGWSVDMNARGDMIIIGADSNDGNGGNWNGHARVFEIIDGQWVQKGQDLDGDEENDYFGYSVAMNGEGDRVIAGAIGNDDNGSASGHTKVLEYNQQTELWEQLGQTIVGESAGDRSGWSVDMNARGDMIIIGADFNDGNGGDDNGHARVFKIIDGQWVQKGQDLDGDEEDDNFGYSVAMNGEGDRVIAGAIYNDDNGPDSGHVKVFKLPTASCSTDSPLEVLTKKSKKNSAKTCTEIANHPRKDTKFCKQNKIKTHCPSTCGECEEHGSSDSIGKFILDNKVRDCKWVQGFDQCDFDRSKLLRIASLCQKDEIRATCRKTCGLFALTSEDDTAKN